MFQILGTCSITCYKWLLFCRLVSTSEKSVDTSWPSPSNQLRPSIRSGSCLGTAWNLRYGRNSRRDSEWHRWENSTEPPRETVTLVSPPKSQIVGICHIHIHSLTVHYELLHISIIPLSFISYVAIRAIRIFHNQDFFYFS